MCVCVCVCVCVIEQCTFFKHHSAESHRDVCEYCNFTYQPTCFNSMYAVWQMCSTEAHHYLQQMLVSMQETYEDESRHVYSIICPTVGGWFSHQSNIENALCLEEQLKTEFMFSVMKY